MDRPHNILIIRLSSLGDVLMSVPAVRAIRRLFPEAHISWLVEGAIANLLAQQDFIDDVIYFPRGTIVRHLKGWHLPTTAHVLKDFVKKLRERRYDCVIDLHGIAKSVVFMYLAHGRKKVGFGKTYAKDMSHVFYDDQVKGPEKRIHKVERYMLAARSLGYEGPVPKEDFHVQQGAKAYVDDFFRSRGIASPVVAINPFASKGSTFKRWPLERYADLIDGIKKELNGTCLIIWGPGEREEAQRLVAMAGERAQLACQTDIVQLYALLTRVDAYVGGDTGTTHLASSANNSVVSIFGPTDVVVNRPYSKEAVIIRKKFDCSPCKKKNCKERTCLLTISPDEVLGELKKLMLKNEA